MQSELNIIQNAQLSSYPHEPHHCTAISFILPVNFLQNLKKDDFEGPKSEKRETKQKYQKLEKQECIDKNKQISVFQQKTKLLGEINGILKNYTLQPKLHNNELIFKDNECLEQFEESKVGYVDHCEQSRETERCSLASFQKNEKSTIVDEQQRRNLDRKQISTDNIIEVLNSPSYKKLKKTKGYSNRKNIIDLQQKYKQILLQKYRLNQLNVFVKQVRNSSQQKNKKYRKDVKHTKNRQIDSIAGMSARKLRIILTKNMKIGSAEAKQIICRAFQEKVSQDKKNKKDLCRIYSKIFKLVSQNQNPQNPKIDNIHNESKLCLNSFNSSEIIEKQ